MVKEEYARVSLPSGIGKDTGYKFKTEREKLDSCYSMSSEHLNIMESEVILSEERQLSALVTRLIGGVAQYLTLLLTRTY